MSAPYSLQTAVEITKRIYPRGLEEVLYEQSPAWGLLPRSKDFSGEGEFIVWNFGVSGGSSATFANAQSNKSGGQYKRAFLTRAKEYATFSIDREFMLATANDKGAIVRAYQQAQREAIYNLQRSVSFQMFRNGGGARGQLAAAASGVGTTTLQLSSSVNMSGFEPGMVVQGASTDGTSGSAHAGTVVVGNVDRENRTLTTANGLAWNNAANIPALADGEYLFRDGDFGVVIKGFEAWLPSTLSPTDDFFDVNRNADPVRLAGIKYAPSGGKIEEVLQNAASLASSYGANPDVIIMNPIDYGALVNSMSSKATIPVPSKMPNIGYDGIELWTPAGRMKVVSDTGCQRYKSWMLTTDTWEIRSLGEFPKTFDEDGRSLLREGNADAYEERLGGYLQLVCRKPGHNVHITLPS